MEREIDMKEVSDGRLYGLRDMVKADCGGCARLLPVLRKHGKHNYSGSLRCMAADCGTAGEL